MLFNLMVTNVKKLVLLTTLSILAGCGDEDYSLDAYTFCQIAIEKSLKSPSTAEFPAYEDHAKKDKALHKYTFNSYVDAQNSFGAKLRRKWTCTAMFSGDDPEEPSNWQVKARLKE